MSVAVQKFIHVHTLEEPMYSPGSKPATLEWQLGQAIFRTA